MRRFFSIILIQSFVLIYLFQLCSCGLPDIIPQINKPSVTTNTSYIYTFSSGDLKPNGSIYNIYGMEIYYKIYKRSEANSKLLNDFQLISSFSSDPTTSLKQNGYRHLANPDKDESNNGLAPVYPISNNDNWNLTIDFSTGAKKTINIYDGQSINSIPKIFYRFANDNSTLLYKEFSAAKMDVKIDSDLVLYRSDTTFNPNDTSFGIIIFTFAQDIDWSFLPFYSSSIMLGPFEIN